MPFRRVAVILWLAAAAVCPARAGGPLIFADDGAVVKWPTTGGITSVTLTLDQGGLGALDNDAANALVSNILSVWNCVSSTTVFLTVAPSLLTTDVTHTNFTPFLDNELHHFNPVIYDTDGLIIDALYGIGARNQIGGFARPVYWISGISGHPAPGNILEVQVVLNGRFQDGVSSGTSNRELTQAEYEGVVIHEAGHALGLDHSQVNALDASNADQPTMFPFFYGGTAWHDLAMDDIGWIGRLYPAEYFDDGFGAITGDVLVTAGMTTQGFQGLNVVARRVVGGRGEASSCVSGYLYWAGFGPDSLAGRYRIPALPPGLYTVEVERILPAFVGGSSVGPLDPPVAFPGISGPEFYNGAGESAFDNPIEKTNVTAAADGTTSGINIILNTLGAGAASWMRYR